MSSMTVWIFSLAIIGICFVGHSEGGPQGGGNRHDTTCKEACKEVQNTNYPGNDIENKKMPSGEGKDECAIWCGTTEGCWFWTFRTSDNWCWLKSANTNIVTANGINSGNKACGIEKESAPICGGTEPTDCECSDLVKKDHNDKDIGACLTQFGGKHWCYVPADSKCSDKKESSREKGLFWSASACTDYSGAPQKG